MKYEIVLTTYLDNLDNQLFACGNQHLMLPKCVRISLWKDAETRASCESVGRKITIDKIYPIRVPSHFMAEYRKYLTFATELNPCTQVVSHKHEFKATSPLKNRNSMYTILQRIFLYERLFNVIATRSFKRYVIKRILNKS